MANQPPKELTTPPEGYEWTGEFRQAKGDEWWAEPQVGAKEDWPPYKARYGATILDYAILRRIKPAYVDVRLPREMVERVTSDAHTTAPLCNFDEAQEIAFRRACREALEQE